MTDQPQRTDAQRIDQLKRIIEAQGIAIALLGHFIGKQHEMFSVYVDQELERLMGVDARTVGTTPADLGATEWKHDYIRQMLNVPK